MRRLRPTVALTAVTMLAAACAQPSAARPAAVPPAANGALCTLPPVAPALSILDWESKSQQTVPGDPPRGWAAEYDADVVHRGNREPQIRIARPPEPVRAGGAASRFELRREDPVINIGTRAELATELEPLGAERWYAFSVYLPKSWAADRSPEIVAQWHQHHSVAGDPPIAIATQQGQWEIHTARDGFSAEKPIGAYVTERWTDWLVHVRWSTGKAGIVQIWQDGQPVKGFENVRGPNTYKSKQGMYLKVGIYKWDWSLQNPTDTVRRHLYLDELRIAESEAGVAIPRPATACYEVGRR